MAAPRYICSWGYDDDIDDTEQIDANKQIDNIMQSMAKCQSYALLVVVATPVAKLSSSDGAQAKR